LFDLDGPNALLLHQMGETLFVSTGNSARRVMAEAILNHLGMGRFVAHSAGTFPKEAPHPLALAELRAMQIPIGVVRSKSWDDFAQADAEELDFVVTICDAARRALRWLSP
jgi:arsenate reductase